jgi:hypothetical protein
VSADESFIVVVDENNKNSTDNTVFILENLKADIDEFVIPPPQNFTSTVPSFAFSLYGGILFTTSVDNEGTSFAACPTN